MRSELTRCDSLLYNAVLSTRTVGLQGLSLSSNHTIRIEPWTGRIRFSLLVPFLERTKRTAPLNLCTQGPPCSMDVSAFALLLAVAVSAFLLRQGDNQAQVQSAVVRRLRWAARSVNASSDDPCRQDPRSMTSGAVLAIRAVARAPAAPFTSVST